jgi:hypothetical protein
MRWLLPIGCLMTIAVLRAGNSIAGDVGLQRPEFAAAISDPFTYCSRIGNMDEPLGGASPIPAALVPYLGAALGLSARTPPSADGYYWRCMDGAVYVCVVGANLPCQQKANRSKRNAGADSFCRDHRDAASVPAYASGHDTIFDWSCAAGLAVRGAATAKLDSRGYRIDIWHRVTRKST